MFNVSEDILEEIKNYDEKILPYEQLGAIEPTTFLEELLSWKEKWHHKIAVMHMGNSIHFVIALFTLFRMGVLLCSFHLHGWSARSHILFQFLVTEK